MKAIFAHSALGIIAGALLLGGCIEKFDITPLLNQGNGSIIGDTNYVEILPPFGGFTSPRGMTVGNDQLLYVTDYEQNSLIMLDAGGRILKTRSILHPTTVVQNSKLDLYVGGETIAPNGRDTLGAVFRIYLVRFDTTYVSRIDTIINSSTGDTTITPVVRDTSYFSYHDLEHAPMRLVWSEPARPQRRFTGIGMFPTNDFLVARTGPDNSSFVDPDSRVMLFNNSDVFITPVPDLVTRPSGGSGITDIRNLTSIFIFPSSKDFILTQTSEGVSYGALWMIFTSDPNSQVWLPKFDPTNPDQRGVDFIRQGRFVYPSGIAYDRRRREVFIVDAALDSVVKFDRNGAFKTESFGKFKTRSADLPGLSSPGGIAFSNDCTLYVVDTGNRIIRRFKLSTLTQCN